MLFRSAAILGLGHSQAVGASGLKAALGPGCGSPWVSVPFSATSVTRQQTTCLPLPVLLISWGSNLQQRDLAQ